MKITLLKLTKSEKKHDLAFADFLIEDIGLILKGCQISTHNKKLIMKLPHLRKEAKEGQREIKFTPAVFKSKERHEAFIKQCLDLVALQVFGEAPKHG